MLWLQPIQQHLLPQTHKLNTTIIKSFNFSINLTVICTNELLVIYYLLIPSPLFCQLNYYNHSVSLLFSSLFLFYNNLFIGFLEILLTHTKAICLLKSFSVRIFNCSCYFQNVDDVYFVFVNLNCNWFRFLSN